MFNIYLLEKVRQELKLTKEKYERYLPAIKEMDIYLERSKVYFAEDNLLAFMAHMITMLIRLETGEKVTGMEDGVLSQLEPEAVSITQGLMKIAEKTYGESDMAETALVAIHIQTALEMMREEGGVWNG